MSLQTIIDSAVSVEINRSKLVAQSLSRSGRVLTVARNWVNPWRFTVTPKPIWTWTDYRAVFEAIINGDRITTHTFKFGNVAGQRWTMGYMGNCPGGTTGAGGSLTGVSVVSFSGTSLVIDTTAVSNGVQIVKVGDVIQPTGNYRYPYVVTAATNNGVRNNTTMTITTHRGYLPQDSYTVASKGLWVGTSCEFYVKVSSLPNVKLTSGRFAEFTGDLQLIEDVEQVA